MLVVAADAQGDWQRTVAGLAAGTEGWDAARDIVVLNKIDLLEGREAPVEDGVALSALSGRGLPELLARLERSAALVMSDGGSGAKAYRRSPAPVIARP